MQKEMWPEKKALIYYAERANIQTVSPNPSK